MPERSESDVLAKNLSPRKRMAASLLEIMCHYEPWLLESLDKNRRTCCNPARMHRNRICHIWKVAGKHHVHCIVDREHKPSCATSDTSCQVLPNESIEGFQVVLTGSGSCLESGVTGVATYVNLMKRLRCGPGNMYKIQHEIKHPASSGHSHNRSFQKTRNNDSDDLCSILPGHTTSAGSCKPGRDRRESLAAGLPFMFGLGGGGGQEVSDTFWSDIASTS